jgi:NAD(P)-dependent dehydrogenase (short-subunit alcohol dehydrogenase family)
MIYPAEKLYDLSGRIALVTGGGTGVGLMIARALASNGAKVYITGRRTDVLQKVVDSWNHHKGSILSLSMDVTDRASIAEAQKVLEQKEGRLHILVNNAGQVGPSFDSKAPEYQNAENLGKLLFSQDPEGWTKVHQANTFSIYFVTAAFLGLLDKGSRDTEGYTSCVINITSVCGLTKLSQEHYAYGSSKAAASHLTKVFAAELALRKIPVRVNAIAPGPFPSEMTGGGIDPKDIDKFTCGLVPLPVHRSGTDEEMAGTALFLASRAGCYMLGQEIAVDGGFLAVNPSM